MSSQPSICSGSYVTLTATVSDSNHSFNYSWSTGETTPSIRINKADTYTISVWDNNGDFQPLSKSITINTSMVPAPPVSNDQVVCRNGTATLIATGADGSVYQWYDAPVGGKFLATGASYTTPQLITQTVYYVETTLAGCTSARTPVNVYVAGKPFGTGTIICPGYNATLSANGADNYTWYDAAEHGNKVGEGSTFTTPVLFKTTTYYVESSIYGCISRVPVTATVSPSPPAPKVSDITVCHGSSATLHADVPIGILNWFDVPAGGTSLISNSEFTTAPLTASATYYVQTTVNDCQSERVPVHVNVNPVPEAPAPIFTCSETEVTLTAASSSSGINQWYDLAVGGNLLATGLTFHTPVLTHSTTYYLANSASGCPGNRIPYQIIITPTIPPSAAGQIICSGSSASLTAISADGGAVEWYDQATAGKLLSKNAIFTTPPLTADATYFVQVAQPGCVNTRTSVKVTVLPAVVAPTAASVTICSGNSAILKAFSKSGNYKWYDSASNGKLLSSSQTLVTPQLNATVIYYVTTSEDGCESPATPVTVTVNPLSVAPSANGTRVCEGSPATLTANAPPGTNIAWYDAATDGTLLASGNTFTTPDLFETITYFAQYSTEGCNSARTPVTVIVDTIPDIKFLYPPGGYATNYSKLITPAVKNGSEGKFSVQPEGLVFTNTNTGEINGRASKPGKYTVTRTSNNPCSVPYSSSITIYEPGGKLTFFYQGPYCKDGVNPRPNIDYVPSSYSSSPGLVFVDPNTGEVNLSASTPGTYTVTRIINYNATVQTCSITINEKVSVQAGDDQNATIGQPIHLAGIIHGASGGKWSGGAGSFSDATLTDAIYTPAANERRVVLRLTTNDSDVCEPKSDQMVITIQPTIIPPTASDVMGCLGSRSTIFAIAPKGDIQWYDAATGGNLLSVGPNFLTDPLTETTTYYAQATIGEVASERIAVKVIVNAPPAPSASGLTVQTGSTATLTASGSSGTYEWYNAPTGGDLLSLKNSYITTPLTNNTSYYVQTTVDGCSSRRTKVDVSVLPLPQIVSSSAENICSGSELTYNITANVATAAFSWSRAAVAGISNPAVNDQKTSIIRETLINLTNAPVNVTYLITSGGSADSPFRYVVTVYPKPAFIGKTTTSIPNGTSSNFQIKFNISEITFNWSRPAINGISNAGISGQTSSIISETLFNTTNAPIDVTYVLQYSPNCTGTPITLTVTVYPSAVITSANNGFACSNSPQNYMITSNLADATFSWEREAAPNIANAAVTNQTASTITETLINTGYSPANVYYVIRPIAHGKVYSPFIYSVVVYPRTRIPEANSNSPVCLGSTIQLRSPLVSGASYLWIGPNEYRSTLQNPDIPNITIANAGDYKLFITINGCTSEPNTIQVAVNQPPLAGAGPNQSVCVNIPAVNLSGTVSGGTVTGVWNSSGNGTFFPSNNKLNAQYIPSEQDRSSGSVTLTLTSTSNDDCLISTSNMIVKLGKSPGVDAGSDIEVCSQSTTVPLAGKVLIASPCKWITSGSGTFLPAATNVDASYVPSAEDIKSGTVKLTLMAITNDQCYITTDDLMVKFIQPATVNAGGIVYVLKDENLTLKPFVSDPDVQYLWTPNIGISDNKIKNPIITGEADRIYTLKVTNNHGCTSQDILLVKVSPNLTIPNTFTPNGDGINDYWEIKGLVAYQQAVIDIFNRYGTKLYHSLGYSQPWDGTYNGQALSPGTYYYIINTKVNNQILSGPITILR
ncbi:PKD-like domain-containing protein [Mucilaginibacter aquaedulcis]|uniref:Ig-like domain-containing protein n=1 Tax=Mucilaginibacter aquaedulcis TaxID=1187081 RepID=UPI0025B363C3|nr:PKD-like domain-containing protein [Mucilaginibacter aquaedulcis]MDN3549173.1 gliding motility-associated C-terminal domain-containing protein [Mucilaginibacter aquaedulcis]